MCLGMRTLISTLIPEAIHWHIDYDSFFLTKEGCFFEKVVLEEDFFAQIERVTLSFSGKGPLIRVDQPTIELKTFSNTSPKFRYDRFLAYRPSSSSVSIREGELRVGELRAYFSYEGGEDEEGGGRLFISSSQGAQTGSLLRADFRDQEELLSIELSVDKLDLAWLSLWLGQGIELTKHLEVKQGEIEGELTLLLGRKLKSMEGSVGIKELILSSDLGARFELDFFNWKGSYAPQNGEGDSLWWQKAFEFVELSKLRLYLLDPLVKTPWEIRDISGNILMEPSQDPSLKLQGIFVREGNSEPFEIITRGRLYKDWEYSFGVALAFQKKPLCHFSGKGHRFDEVGVKVKSENFPFEYLNYLLDFDSLSAPSSLHFLGGQLSFQTFLSYKAGALSTFNIEHFQGERLSIQKPEHNIKAEIRSLEIEADIDLCASFDESNLNVYWHGLELHSSLRELSYLSGTGIVKIDKGVIEPSLIKATLNDTDIELTFKGAIKEPRFSLFASGNLENFGKDFYPNIRWPNQPVDFFSKGYIDQQQVHFQGEMQVGEEQNEFKYDLFARIKDLFGKGLFFSKLNGWIKCDHLDDTYLSPFLTLVDPDLELNGSLECEAIFSPEGVDAQASFSDISIKNQKLFAKVQSNNPLSMHYQFEGGQLSGNLSFEAEEIAIFEPSLKFDQMRGDLNFSHYGMEITDLEAHFQKAEARGWLSINSSGLLEIEATELRSDIESVIEFSKQFEPFQAIQYELKGEVGIEEKFFHLKSNLENSSWGLFFPIEKAGIKLSEKIECDNLSFQLSYDSSKELLELVDIEGDLNFLQGPSYFLDARYLTISNFQTPCLDFDIRIGSQTYEYLRVKGGLKRGEDIDLTLDEELSQWFGKSIGLKRCRFSSDWKVKEIKLESEIELQFITPHIKPYIDFLPPVFLEELEGVFSYDFTLQDNQMALKILSPSIGLKEKLKHPFEFNLFCENNHYHLETICWGEHRAGLSAERKEEQIDLEKFTYTHDQVQIRGGGGAVDLKRGSFKLPISSSKIHNEQINCQFEGMVFASRNQNFSLPKIEGEFDVIAKFPFLKNEEVRSIHPIKMALSNEKGLVLNELKLLFLNEITEIDQLVYNLNGLKIGGIKSELPTKELEKFDERLSAFPITNEHLKIQGEITRSLEGHLSITGEVDKLQILSSPRSFHLNSTQFSYDSLSNSLSLFSHAFLDELPLNLEFKGQVLPDSLFTITLSNYENEAMVFDGAIDSRRGLLINRIKGKLYGMQTDFSLSPRIEHPGVLMMTGHLLFDFYYLRPALSEGLQKLMKKWDVGSGYELTGDVILFKDRLDKSYFKGFFKGRDFHLRHFQLKTLQSEIFISKEQVTLSDFCISDEALFLKIQSMNFKNLGEKWIFQIPQIHLKDFRPSLLSTIGGHKGKLRPFVISDLNFENIKGDSKDLDRLEGEGKLEFTNRFKRNPNLFDIPIEILGRIGLDTAIMIPISGEMSYKIQKGKINFTTLSECYSEGKRSRFILSKKQPSYLDFEGNFHIDIKMKQYVLLAFTQPFTLSIRGLIDDPKFSLRK